MALETLKNVTEIDGFKVLHLVRKRLEEGAYIMQASHRGIPKVFGIPESEYDLHRSKYPILIDHVENRISFQIQNGSIKEVGQNGCQLTTLVEAAVKMLNGLNRKFHCNENDQTIERWEDGLNWQKERTKRRERAGIEGYNKEEGEDE